MPRFVSSAVLLAALMCLALPTGIARAGTLCGTITDGQSSAPVAHAGVFLRTPAGAYTGINGATDGAGSFCIAGVPAGTYDLEVRVDDYAVAYLRGVIVTATQTDVSIGAGPVRARLASPAPNPARDATRLRWTLAHGASVRLGVYAIDGRFIRGWSAASMPAGEHSIAWDLRDASGRAIPAGTYFVRLETDGALLVRTLIHPR